MFLSTGLAMEARLTDWNLKQFSTYTLTSYYFETCDYRCWH